MTNPTSKHPRDLAIVIPVFNEEETIELLIEKLLKVAEELTEMNTVFYFVDDGSSDKTLQNIQEHEREDDRFQWIQLSRNFGLQAALTAGLSEIDADAIVFMDADLQDPPELIPELVKEWQNGADVVLAKRRSREERGLKGLLLRAFHVIMPAITASQNMKDTGNFGLLSAKAVEALRQLPERNRYFPGLRAWIGFQYATVVYNRNERKIGEAKQSLTKLIRYAADAIFSFSYLPLRFLTGMGLLISTTGFLLGLYFALKRIAGIENAFTGFTTIVILTVCLGGFQLIALGVIGEYLLRIYEEVKGRPPYIVQSTSSRKRDMNCDGEG